MYEQSEPATAARLWGALEAWRESKGIPLQPFFQDMHDQSIAGGRQKVGDAEWAIAWLAGCAMSLDEAVVLALEAGSSNSLRS